MSSIPTSAANNTLLDSSTELNALMNDVQNLLHAYNTVKIENTQLKATIRQQNTLMQTAHTSLMMLLKRLPSKDSSNVLSDPQHNVIPIAHA
jgi:regulator of replication initiation timing